MTKWKGVAKVVATWSEKTVTRRVRAAVQRAQAVRVAKRFTAGAGVDWVKAGGFGRVMGEGGFEDASYASHGPSLLLGWTKQLFRQMSNGRVMGVLEKTTKMNAAFRLKRMKSLRKVGCFLLATFLAFVWGDVFADPSCTFSLTIPNGGAFPLKPSGNSIDITYQLTQNNPITATSASFNTPSGEYDPCSLNGQYGTSWSGVGFFQSSSPWQYPDTWEFGYYNYFSPPAGPGGSMSCHALDTAFFNGANSTSQFTIGIPVGAVGGTTNSNAQGVLDNQVVFYYQQGGGDFPVGSLTSSTNTYTTGYFTTTTGTANYISPVFTGPGCLDKTTNQACTVCINVGGVTVYDPAQSTLVQVNKVSNGGVGKFTYTTNGPAISPITTTTAGTAQTGDAVPVTTFPFTITESEASGFTLTGASCADSNAPGDGNPTGSFGTLSGNMVTIPATYKKNNANIVCTLTSTKGGPTIVNGQVFTDTGLPSGVASNGIKDSGESTVAGVKVSLTNCAATTLDTTVTNSTGTYWLSTAANYPVGANLCVVAAVSGSFDPIGASASVSSARLFPVTSTTVSGTSYFYANNPPTNLVQFSADGQTHNNLNFGVVPVSTLAPTYGSKNGLPGSTVTYPYVFTAGTSATVRFSTSPLPSGWSENIYADPTCSGVLSAGATLLYPPTGSGLAVAPGQAVCIIAQVLVPAAANYGDRSDVVVYATLSTSLNGFTTLLRTGNSTIVGNSALTLTKLVRNVDKGGPFATTSQQAKSGEKLEYQISYTNNGAGAISNLTVSDNTPSYTTFVSSTQGTTPATLTACNKNTPFNPSPAAAPVSCSTVQTFVAGQKGAVIWQFTGTLPPGGQGVVSFQVQVD